MNINYYKIYFHNTTKNETLSAIRGAFVLDDRPMLVYISKDANEEDWSSLATAKFKKYLKTKKIVCLKIEDSEKHCRKLIKQAKKLANPDGLDGKHPCRLVLIMPAMVLVPTGFDLKFDFDAHCIKFLADFTGKSIDDSAVIDWIDNVIPTESKASEEYRLPSGEGEPAPEPEPEAVCENCIETKEDEEATEAVIPRSEQRLPRFCMKLTKAIFKLLGMNVEIVVKDEI